MMAKDRQYVEEEAVEAFRHWMSDLTDGELRDMLVGNAKSYGNMPDLEGWMDHQNPDSPLRGNFGRPDPEARG